MSGLRTGNFAINSHKKGEPGVYTSCGNIPAGEATATAAPSPSALSIAVANFRFSPDTLEVEAGQEAQLRLTGDGRGHTFTVESLGVDVVVGPGATETIEFEVPVSASGTIPFICRFHSSGGRGMVGELKNRLSTGGVLGSLIERFMSPTVNFSPKPVLNPDETVRLPGLDNHAMGTVFEDLIRRFNEENNEEAGEHWTPRDAVELMAKLVFLPIKDQIQPTTYLLYDGALGTGGMLTIAEQTLQDIAEERGQHV